MFWRFGFHTQSAIDTLLEKDEVTLEEVLEEDELIQECKTHNRKLIDFLSRPEVIEALLAYIVDTPPDDLDDDVKFKYPNLAAEIFGCEVLAICDSLIHNEQLLGDFWGFLDQPAPLNPIQGSYFCRVFSVLLQKKTEETIRFLQSQENMIQTLVTHIGTSAFMDLIIKLVSCEDVKEGEGILPWVLEHGLVEKLLAKFDPTEDEMIHANVSQVLIDLLNIAQMFGTRNIMVEYLKGGTCQKTLLDLILKEGPNRDSSIFYALGVEIELIQRSLGFVQEGEMPDVDFKEEDLTEFMDVLVPLLEPLHNIMINAKPSEVSVELMDSTPGHPQPLGHLRLKIVEFFVIVLHVNHPLINQKFLDLGVLPCYIDLLFKYQWNNFLHSLVHDLIVRIFNSDLEHGEALMLACLNEGNLTNKIIQGAKDNEADPEGKGFRRGYMGHVVLIANHLSKFVELPEVSQEVKKHFLEEKWVDFEKVLLEEVNQRDNKPLGGHRPINTGDDLFQGLDETGDQFDDDDDDVEFEDEIVEKSLGGRKSDDSDSDEEGLEQFPPSPFANQVKMDLGN